MAVNLGQITATTLKNRSPYTVDNISNNNKLLRELRARGQWTQAGGGRTLDCPIDYIQNGTGKFYSGGQDSWSIPTEEVIDAATYDWKFYGVFTYYTEAERVKNRGKYAAVRLQKAKIKNMERTMANEISTSLYSDGTGDGGLELGGLQLLISDDPTAAGTVGGIDQQANAFWRNEFSAAAATTAATIQSRMNDMWLAIERGTDVPHIVLNDNIMFTHYWESLTDQQRFTSSKSGNTINKNELMYQSAKFMYDDQCPASHQYMVNLDHIEFQYAEGRLFDVGDSRQVTNANYDVIPAFFAGNLTCSRRASAGVIIAS